MKFLVTIIMLTFYFSRIQTRRREDYPSYDKSGAEPVMGMSSNNRPRLNLFKDQSMYDYDPRSRYFYFADDFGTLHLIDSKEEADTAFLGTFWKNPTFNFLLFTRTNPHIGHILEHGNELRLIESNFDLGKRIVMIAHGWKGNSSSPIIKTLTQAFLEDEDVNIIVFDWGELANSFYVTAKAGTSEAGKSLGRFIIWLATSGYTMYEKVHLVGHSLGAHLVGNAGRETGGVVARLTGLDPAGPLWYSNRLVSTDALYVEVIHTNAGALGYRSPCGDADFYPNGGHNMPGCGSGSWYDTVIRPVNVTVCSHSRAWEYMASSIVNNRFEAKQCKDYNEMEKDKCNGSVYLMGNSDLHKEGRGIFRLNTLATYPYI